MNRVVSATHENWSTATIKKYFCEFKKQLSNSESDLLFIQLNGDSQQTNWIMEIYFLPYFMKQIKKHKIEGITLWKTLQNLQYGYNYRQGNSPGGKDGIFNVNENYTPSNVMVKKLYANFLNKETCRLQIKPFFHNLEKIQGVRIVSHSLRLLGFVEHRGNQHFVLVLVDVDAKK